MVPGADRGRAGGGLSGRHDRPLRDQGLRRAFAARGLLGAGVHPGQHRAGQGGRGHGRPRGGAHRPAARRPALHRALPVPRRAHAVVLGRPGAASSTTASAAAPGGDAIRFVQETEGRDFGEAIELLAERTGIQLERARGGPAGRGAPAPPAAPVRAARPHRRASTPATCGSRPRRPGAREYLLGRGLDEQVLRDFRVGFSPEGVGPGAHERPRARATASRSWRRRTWSGAAGAAASTTASAAGSCSRWPTGAGGWSASGARRAAARVQPPTAEPRPST